jgi:hypothetical protein
MQMEEQSIKPQTFLEQKREQLLKRQKRLLSTFEKAVTTEGKICRLNHIYERIYHVKDFIEAINQIEREGIRSGSTAKSRYVISSLFLHECFKDLTADSREGFFFITGILVNGAYVLNKKVEFQHQKRTAVAVVGQLSSTHNLLIKLEQFGHRLLGSFHSHPGKGQDATHPSGIDQKFQKRLEDGGHVAVAAIFSRDGYVRFFRMDKEPEIEVYGKGVEKHERNLYRLTNLDQD